MRLGRILNTVDSWGFFFIRVALGCIFMAHGAQKLFGLFGGAGFAQTMQQFHQGLGIPMPLTFLAMVTEFFGGLAVLTGCLTRLAALGLAVVMGVAIVKVHWANGFFLNLSCTPGTGQGIEYNLALLAMALGLVISGPGYFSIDRWISRL
jgi:putative oxidoreductase